ncbi:hypothetical protein [Amycolatopsis sp. NPDC051128]
MAELARFVVDRGGALVADVGATEDVDGFEVEADGVCVVAGLGDTWGITE